MPGQLTITVNNKNDSNQIFRIFSDVAQGGSGVDEVWMNAWGPAAEVNATMWFGPVRDHREVLRHLRRPPRAARPGPRNFRRKL